MDAPDLGALYGEHEWWADRDVPAVREALEGTGLALGVRDDGLVAATRVLTDGVFYATVYDVIVAEERRGEGFGRALMEAVVCHETVTSVDTVDLRCREGLVSFYEQFGFEVHDPTLEVDGQGEGFVKMNHEG